MDPERALARIGRWLVSLSVAGVAAAFVLGGWHAAGGFSLGAAVSILNYRWLKKLVHGLGPTAPTQKSPRARHAVILGLRYLLLGLAAYVILKFSDFSLMAALGGLFVPAAAVILEILFELIYAGT